MSHFADLDALKKKTQDWVAMAREGGAETAVAVIDQQREFSVEVRGGDIENLTQADSFGASLTISKNQRRASVDTCDLSEKNLRALVKQALTLCQYTDRDPFYTLPKKELLAKEMPQLDLFDSRILDFEANEAIAMVKDLENRFTGIDSRLKSDGASMLTVLGASVLANSLGFCQSEESTIASFGASGFAEDQVQEDDLNSGRKQNGGWYSRALHFDDLEAPDKIAGLAAKMVLRKLGARKPQSGKFPVYFEPKAAKTLWQHLFSAMAGGKIFRKQSYLAGRLNTPVCSKAITLIDNPHIVRGLGSRGYDREGVASKQQALVKNGRLQTYLLNTYSANKLDLESTGHAGGVANVLVQPGNLSEAEMLQKMDRGVWVTSVFGQGYNVNTGDYSRGAQGIWVENGQPQYPIMEFTLNSNIDQLLQNIVMVGSNVFKPATIVTPGIVVGEMTISGT